ncbi:TKL/IRAK protein kinase [Sphaeroforma arctica JP610]|uniref:non-specific serine/threonine protein kinase n=1 Tax=Sphaeroforma arctica JP610 TaxID=667725 RepID=A0A0L0G498_9EUKA|nr:TKL/IRAK protein kinase [Sphaeroforma arctica JP610]KNC83880.1 TKL/IRAK protein kinase [Sphaeroforma arctica JP610]|eukprot:XP_014157782.1 TKL/IRAK protein kinase [Sphaeroforma arctica JP610]
MTYVEPPSSTRVNILPQSQDDKGLMYASRTASETVNTAATVRPEIPVRRSEPVAVYASIVPQYQQTLGSIAGFPSPRVSTPSPGLAYSPTDTMPHTDTQTRTAHQEQVGNQRRLSEHIQPSQPAHSQLPQQSSNQPANSAKEYIRSNNVAYLQQHSHPASGDAGYDWQPRDVDVSDRAKSDHQASSRGQQPVDMKQTDTHTHLELPTARRRSVQNAPTSPLLSYITARRRQSPARAHTLKNSGPVLEFSANGTQLSTVGSATAGQDNAVDGERNIVDASDELNELRRAMSLPPSTGAETGLGMNILLGTEGQPDLGGRLDAELHQAHADGHMLTHKIAATHMDNIAVTPGAGHVPLSPITSQQLRDGVNITVSTNTHDHQEPHPHRVYFDEASSRRAQTLTPTVPQRQSDECVLPKLGNGNERVQLDRVSMGTEESSANQPAQDMQSLDSKGGYWGSPLFNSDGAPNVGTSIYRHSSYPAPTTPNMKTLAITEDEHSQFALGKMLTMGGAPVSPLGRSEANIDSAGDMNAGIQQATPTKAYKQRPLSAPTQPSQGLAQIPADPTLGEMVVAQPHASVVEHPNAQERLPWQTYDPEQVQIQSHAQAQAPMDLHHDCVSIVQYESLKYQSSNIENALKRELMTTRKRLEEVKDERDLAERRLQEFQYLANVTQPSDFGGSGLINFKYDELQHATNNWDDKNKIGEGGFGPVYRGVLHGQSVAIKTQSTGSDQGALEFAREVAVLAKYRHKHLVSLMGIVRSASYLCLVYEYMSLGSVRDVLDHKGLGVDALPLTWIDRISISLQSAKGLLYLHRGTTPPVLHLDFKTANILLDKDLHAKVADFGLVRSTPELMQGTHAMTRRLNGTHGYICPEYASSGRITDRTDVYSFGVVLLEMLTGLRAIDETLPVADLVNRVKDYTKFRCGDFKSRQRVSMSTDVSGEKNFSGSTLTALEKMYTEREAPGNQQIEFDTVRERELAQLQRYTSSDNVSIDPDRVRNVMDGIHSDGDWPLDQVTRFLNLALHCTKSRATKRPTMSEAMGRLEEMYLLAEGVRTGDFNLTAFNKKKSLDRMTSDIGESVVSPVKLAAESPTENDTLCVICCSAPRSAEFQPCGHCVLCHNCAMGMATNGDSCPTCLSKIDEVLSRFEVV